MEAAEAAAWSLAWCLLKLSLETPAAELVSEPWLFELDVPDSICTKLIISLSCPYIKSLKTKQLVQLIKHK